jgi:hypothetical protein
MMTKRIADVKNFVRCADGATRKFTSLSWDGPAEQRAAWDHMHNSLLAVEKDFTPGSVMWNNKCIVGFKNVTDDTFTAY